MTLLEHLKTSQAVKLGEINPAYIQAVARATNKTSPETVPLAKRQFIEQTIHLNVPEKFREKYLKVILKNHRLSAKTNSVPTP